jgi:hypothetical protein
MATKEAIEAVGEALRKECMNIFGSTWSYDVAWRLAETALRTAADFPTLRHQIHAGGPPCPTCGFAIRLKKAEPFRFDAIGWHEVPDDPDTTPSSSPASE